jgi:hypothetical protein
MSKTLAPALCGDGSRLVLTLMCNDDRWVHIKRAARMQFDEAGRLMLYDSRDRVTDCYGLGTVRVMSIKGIGAVN